MKRILSVILAMVLLLSFVPANVFAAEDFVLGTVSADMLDGGGKIVQTGDGTYFSENGTVWLVGESEMQPVFEAQAENLNFFNGALYFTQPGNHAFDICRYDLSENHEEILLSEVEGTAEQMYVINGTEIYYLSEQSVWKYSLADGQLDCLLSVEALYSFVPTPYGLVYAIGSMFELTVYAGDHVAVQCAKSYHVDFDVSPARIAYTAFEGDFEVELEAAFHGEAVPREYCGYGMVDELAMLSEEYHASDAELAAETQTAKNAAASAKRALNGAQASAEAIRGTLTNGQKNAQKRAYQMTDIAWTPKGDILGWDSGLTYKTGTTYYGLPYGQPVNASYVPWSTDLTGFINQVNNASGKMYTSYSAYNKRAPYYSTDCSAFVSWALDLPARQTTSGIASYGTLISTTSYANIQVGDYLNLAGSHVVMCTDITYDANGAINGIEISEATVVAATKYCCQRTWYGTGFGSNSLSYFTTKYFGGGYKLYRSKTISNVSYSHVCVSPVVGDVCSACGYGTQTPTTPDTPSDGQPKFGIDVSYAQGTINWDLVAPQIDFAIIRCGYGSDMTSQDDTQWERNVSECERLGIPYGVYLFSYVDSDAKAASEAQHVIRLLEGHTPTLPVFYDLESSTTGACTQANILRFTTIFCNAIEAAGYNAGVYANLNWWRNHLPSAEYDKWYRWVAQYNTSCTYDGEYCMWQNTDGYQMSGITANTVDTDYWYGDFPETPAPAGSYKVTFKVPTDYAPVSSQVVSSGSSIILPGIETNHCGYTFMGWTTSVVSATTTQPTFYYAGQSFTPSKSMTLRAVFKYYKSGSAVKGDIYYPACDSSQTGLAAALSSVGATDTSLAYRRDHVAAENFIYNYSGTAAQNTLMLNLLKAGMLVNPAVSETYTAYYNTSPGVCRRATAQTTVAATCTAPGTKVTSCSFCGYSKTAEIAALGHSYTAVVTQPACTEKGSTTYTCKRCGDTYNEQSEPALQHDYIYHVTQPTCTEKGYTRATCSRCDFDEILDYTYVNALGHDMVAQTPIAPTCTEDGYTPYLCSRCGAQDIDNITDKLGHIYEYKDNGNGTHQYFCSRCNEVFDAAENCVFDDGMCIGCGHIQVTANIGDYVRMTTAPEDWSGTYLIICEENLTAFNGSLSTPNAAGNYTEVTVFDGVIVGSEALAAYAVTVEKIAGTNYYTIRLSNGKYMGSTGSSTGINASTTKYQNAISLGTNGNIVIANTSGTNTYNFRFNTASSSNRFAFYAASTGKPVYLYKYMDCPHSWHSKTTSQATCTAAGEVVYTCSACGKTYTETVPALGHDEQIAVIPETCVTLGRTIKTCSRCDYRSVTFDQTIKWSSWSATNPQITDADLVKTRTAYRYRDLVTSTSQITYVADWPAGFDTANSLYSTYNASVPENGQATVVGYIYWHWCRGTYAGGPIDRKIQPSKTTDCVSFASFFSMTDPATLNRTVSENLGNVTAYNYPNADACRDSQWWYAIPVYTQEVTSSDWGAWSTWTGTERIASETRQVETRIEYARITTQPNGEHSYVNGVCEYCGDQSIPAALPKISSAYLRLNENINMVYAVSIPDGFENPHMAFTLLGETFTVSDYTVNESGEYCFELTRIVPQYMGENISATVYASNNGTEYSDTVANYSVKAYCENQLAKYPNDASLKTLLSDLLTYGAAAQQYTGYRTDALVTNGLSLAPSTYPSLSGKTVQLSGTVSSAADWKSATLILSNTLAVRFTFTAQSVENLTVQCSIDGRTQAFDADEFVSCGDGLWYVDFRGIKATEFDDTVTASFAQNGTQVGRSVGYSVNTYICSTQNNTAIPGLAQLVQAIYNYGASAKVYSTVK